MDKIELKKRAETRRIILLVVLILFESSFFDWLRTLHIYYGVYDYTVTYKEELDTIFGDDYEVGPPETFYGYYDDYRRGEQYYCCYSTWPIEYTDSRGGKHQVTLSNADSRDCAFEWDVFGWMVNLADDHFEDVCREVYYSNFFRPRLNIPEERYKDAFRKYIQDNVIKSFKDPDKLPHLYEMSVEDWFVTYPSYIEADMPVSCVNDLLDLLNEMTDGRFNLKISTGYETRYYIMGKLRAVDYGRYSEYYDFDLALYQEYEKMGMFD